jgi:hypothetical protein
VNGENMAKCLSTYTLQARAEAMATQQQWRVHNGDQGKKSGA